MNLWIILSTVTVLAVLDIATGEGRGCETRNEGDESFSESITIPKMKWTETPSVIPKGKRKYQVMGRVVHMKYLQEHFAAKEKINFGRTQKRPNRIQLEVLADTVYIEGVVRLRGIKKLTVYSRKVVSGKDSQLDVKAPILSQEFDSLAPGTPGVPGLSGVAGPTVKVYTQVSQGYMFITSSGGNGNQGQPGADGRKGADKIDTKPPRSFDECKRNNCNPVGGYPGDKGNPGQDGGNAGTSGDGGEAGKQRLYVNKIIGNIKLKTCPGQGGEAPVNGNGGLGGKGSTGGTGFSCRMETTCIPNPWAPLSPSCDTRCKSGGATSKANDGAKGDDGTDGQTPMVPGSNGQIEGTYVNKHRLSDNAKSKYPLALLKMMKRYAEDRIWANDINDGKDVLKFLIVLMRGRKGIKAMRADSKRRLGFLDKVGYDRFGNNKLSAPLMKWERLKENAEDIESYAKDYEDAYNTIQGSVRQQEDITKILKDLAPRSAKIQVRNQIKRQKAARGVDQSQKRLYTDAITQIEERMKGTLEAIRVMLVDLQAEKNMQHLFAILQGLTGFVGALKGTDPIAALSSAFSIIEAEATRCFRGTLEENKAKIEKWVKFGKAYEALEDSSDLNFDTMDVQSVPEIMKADLEMNKEGLLADLVCLLEVDLPEHKTAKFKEQIERFFIDGATRIDLIAQVMELDNNIGTYNYDIDNLKETAEQIETVNKAKGTPIADSIRQEFLDNLLNVYEELETSFSKQLYLFYKGFEFRSLWNMDEKMATFQRRAATLAKGTGYLQGVTSLTKALQEITKIEMAARSCFTSKKPKIGIHKWSFDNSQDSAMFEELYQSYTTFSLEMSQACPDCYNVRLLKIYVELYGTAQDQSVPDKVRLKLRPMSRSYFKVGQEVKEYHQPLASWRYLNFDRFKISDATKCREEKEQGRDGGFYCMTKDDKRLTKMCCHPLITAPACDDALMGEEECRSVFGTYNISIPIDPQLDCNAQITYKNCKNLDRRLFTHMNVWTTFMYWPESYPETPADCGIQKRNATAEPDIQISRALLTLKDDPN